MHLFSYFSPFVISPFPPLDSSPYLSIHDPPLFLTPKTSSSLSSVFHPHPSSQSLNSSSHQTIHLLPSSILSLPPQNSILHLLLLSNTPSLCLYNSYFIFFLIHFNTWSLAISFAWSLAWPLPLIIHISLPSALNLYPELSFAIGTSLSLLAYSLVIFT